MRCYQCDTPGCTATTTQPGEFLTVLVRGTGAPTPQELPAAFVDEWHFCVDHAPRSVKELRAILGSVLQ